MASTPLRNKLKREALKHVPRRLMRDRHLRFHYSQFGEDTIIADLFPRKYQGFYVDVGAHHPRFLSNTYLLSLRNWSGVNIDPSPEAISVFERERPGDINLCCAVGITTGSARFYRYRNPAFDTLSLETVASEAWRGEPVSVVDVPVRPLNDVLEEHASRPIDYLNIDIEGLDFDVLSSLDFSRFPPKVVSVEMPSVDLDKLADDQTYSLLRSRGYQMTALCKLTGIFVTARE